MSWTDAEWLPIEDRVSDQELQNLWDSSPDSGYFYHSGTHTMIVSNLEYQKDLEDVILDLDADKRDLKDAVNKGLSIIEDLRYQLAHAKKPDETEALAALRADTSRVQERQRDEIKSLKEQLDAETKRANDLHRQLTTRNYHLDDAKRSARRLLDTMNSLTVAGEPDVPMAGRTGQTQRDLADQLAGGIVVAPPPPKPKSLGANALEID
jgi:hypothetical protein